MYRKKSLKYRLAMLMRKGNLSKEEYSELVRIQNMLASL